MGGVVARKMKGRFWDRGRLARCEDKKASCFWDRRRLARSAHHSHSGNAYHLASLSQPSLLKLFWRPALLAGETPASL